MYLDVWDIFHAIFFLAHSCPTLQLLLRVPVIRIGICVNLLLFSVASDMNESIGDVYEVLHPLRGRPYYSSMSKTSPHEPNTFLTVEFRPNLPTYLCGLPLHVALIAAYFLHLWLYFLPVRVISCISEYRFFYNVFQIITCCIAFLFSICEANTIGGKCFIFGHSSH